MTDTITVVHHSPAWADAYYVYQDGDWERVNQQRVWAYAVGKIKPRYALPAIYRGKDYANYFYLGYVTAENGWHVEDIYRMLGII